jgi:putative ATP-dependent endonuclease of the OLD family
LTLLQHLAQATSAAAEADGVEAPEDTHDEVSPQVSDQIDKLAASAENTGAVHEAATPYTLPGLILAIEEPELYQHPTKQRHFASVLSALSSGQLAGVARQMQVLFATHSSLFVSMDRFEEVRLARRRAVGGDAYKECELKSCTLAEVARTLEQAHAKPEGTYSADGLRPRLHIISSEIAEGFFADAVVLVEGPSDRAAILAASAMYATHLEELGIAVLAVDGKSKLDKSATIFSCLEVPTFLVWDCDKRGGQIEGVEHNRALQRLMGLTAEEIVDAHTKIAERHACFENELEATLKEEIGLDVYESCIQQIKKTFSIERNDDVEKAPFAMRALLTAAASQGRHSESLRRLVLSIAAMRQPSGAAQQKVERAST